MQPGEKNVSLWLGKQLDRRGAVGVLGRGAASLAVGLGLTLSRVGTAQASCTQLYCPQGTVGCCAFTYCWCCNPFTHCPWDGSCYSIGFGCCSDTDCNFYLGPQKK